MAVIGVISDTHVPDRAPALHPRVLQVFRQAGVERILHDGDVMVPGVLDELARVAPVQAVRGNRDFFALRHLPTSLSLECEGVKIGLAHGHGSWDIYLKDKMDISLYGKRAGRYLQRMLLAFPEADVIVFGHLHVPGSLWLEGKLVFNPGSACCPWPKAHPPTVGLLHIQGGKAQGEIIELG